ncbi:MAG: MGDG synthase family glycosyltransferase [Longimicrobiales bacterium]
MTTRAGPHSPSAPCFRSFRRLLLRGGWDLCICTHFLPAQLAAGRAGMPPCALVVTDYTLHRYWAQPRVRNYFVARPELAMDIRTRITDANVQVTGIPIDPTFAQSISRQDARRRIGLEADRPVITVMGGGFGLNIEDHIEPLLACGVDDAQLLVICGRNVAARTRLERRKLPARVHVLGFVSGIQTILAAADVVVTKPGGLTTSEALALGRPLLLTRPLPGHEEANADVLLQLGSAQRVDRPETLAAMVRSLFEQPERLAAMSAAARSIGSSQAARNILQHAEAGMSEAVAA